MDFNYKKPTHLFAMLAVLAAFFMLIGLSLLTFFNMLPTTSTSQLSSLSENSRFFVEIFTLVIQLLIVVIGIFLIVPLLWYTLVNKFSLRQIFDKLQLRLKGIDKALLWGILAVFAGFAITIVINLLIIQWSGIDAESLSNIPDLEQIFSPISLYILVAVQPIGEEIFFRGFLLDKITSVSGPKTAMVTTSVLFGLSHLSYGMAYTAVMAGALGLIFAFVVMKTKNLYASIVAHIAINVISLTIYFLDKSLGL